MSGQYATTTGRYDTVTDGEATYLSVDDPQPPDAELPHGLRWRMVGSACDPAAGRLFWFWEQESAGT